MNATPNIPLTHLVLYRILREFRPWLDAARMFFLLSSNIGIAAFFTYYNPKFQCPDLSQPFLLLILHALPRINQSPYR